jgi:hypothetical protein
MTEYGVLVIALDKDAKRADRDAMNQRSRDTISPELRATYEAATQSPFK